MTLVSGLDPACGKSTRAKVWAAAASNSLKQASTLHLSLLGCVCSRHNSVSYAHPLRVCPTLAQQSPTGHSCCFLCWVQTTAQDHLVVAVVWSELEQLLTALAGPSDMFIRCAQTMVPTVDQQQEQERVEQQCCHVKEQA